MTERYKENQKWLHLVVLFVPSWLISVGVAQTADQIPRPSHSWNAILVLVDGLRWQEVFSGAEEALISRELGGINVNAIDAIRKEFWRDSPEARREALLPFFWKTIARQGQLLGNQNKGCVARVSNGHNFSYPGYSEMLVGFADDRIDSNAKKPNPNVTVFEWLHGQKKFAGRTAAIAAWDVVPWIFNRERCGFYVNGGCEPIELDEPSPQLLLLNRLKAEVPSRFAPDPYDAITFHSALEYFKAKKPRLFYLSFGETDEWGHVGRYDEYLIAARRTDQYIRELWELAQSLPSHKDMTTLIVACDHGRGDGKEWRNHNRETKGSENIWIALLGPDTPPLGERADTPTILQAQIASTLAAALGEDYCAAEPKAARPIAGAVGSR